MKVDPATIAPELWAAEDSTGCTFALVCGRRFGYTAAPVGTAREVPEGIVPESFTLADVIHHPVMVEIMPCPCVVHLGKTLRSDHSWTRVNVSIARLSVRAAQIALSEAYRGLKFSRLNHETMQLEWKTDVAAFRDYKGGTPYRNLNICLQWERWERNATPHAERVAQLAAMGFKCSEKALARYAEEHGL